MMPKQVLSVERRVPEIHVLCSFHQCRLKSVFLHTETQIMDFQLLLLQQASEQYVKVAAELRRTGFLKIEHYTRLMSKADEVKASFEKDLESMGYESLQTFTNVTAASIAGTGLLGGVGMLTHVSLTSTSLGAWLAGTGTWASLSAGATAGLATGGILLAVGAVAGLAYLASKGLTWGDDSASKEIPLLMCTGMDNMKKAHTAQAQYKNKLLALDGSLRALEVMTSD